MTYAVTISLSMISTLLYDIGLGSDSNLISFAKIAQFSIKLDGQHGSGTIRNEFKGISVPMSQRARGPLGMR